MLCQLHTTQKNTQFIFPSHLISRINWRWKIGDWSYLFLVHLFVSQSGTNSSMLWILLYCNPKRKHYCVFSYYFPAAWPASSHLTAGESTRASSGIKCSCHCFPYRPYWWPQRLSTWGSFCLWRRAWSCWWRKQRKFIIAMPDQNQCEPCWSEERWLPRAGHGDLSHRRKIKQYKPNLNI